jgi:hypothetical protein
MTKRLQKLLSFVAVGAALLAPQAADAQYCATNHSYGCYYRLSSFSTSGGTTNISHGSTSCSSSWGPTNPNTSYTTSSHTAMLGTTVNYNVGISYYWGMYTAIWVDWNADGDFTDGGEAVHSQYHYYSYGSSGSFTVPTTAAIGPTRMRVMSNMYYSPTPCFNSYDYGNTIDYTFNVTSPCASVASVTTTPFSKSATFNWTSTAGSVGYDYKVTQGASFNGAAVGSGTTTNTTATVAGLTPATNYYIHVKNKCAVYPAAWASFPFTTSSCSPPVASLSNITHNSATVLWNSVSIANRYEYVASTDPNPPGVGATLQTSTGSSFMLNNLDPETTYYVYIRSVCSAEISEWGMASFTTMAECAAPVVDIVRSSVDPTVVHWQPVHTAVAYEYAINSSATPPALGTTEYGNSLTLTPLPNDKKPYYFHIRSKCVSIFNTSNWATAQLREADPTAISSINSGSMIQAYPNPVTNILTVQIDGMDLVSGNITVTDVTGKTVLTTTVNSSTTNIDMSTLTAGAYFVKYANGSQSQTFRINKI